MYVLTGATGHVGNNILRYLLEKDEAVRILVRRDSDESFQNLNVEVRVGNLLDETFLEENIKPGDIVIHSAGLVDITKGNEQKMYNTNVLMTCKITDICIKNSVRLIYIGSVDAIYKDNKIENIIEPQSYYPDKLKDNYARTKAIASKYVLDKLKNNTLNGCIILPSAVIGPNDYKVSNVGQALLSCINRKMMGRIKGGYNFIDARDLAEAVYHASIGCPSYQYIISGENVSIDEMIRIIYHYLKRDKLPLYYPLWLVYIAAIFTPLVCKIKKTKPIFTTKMIKTVNSNHNYDNSLAKKELNLKIRSHQISICDAINWLENNKITK